MMEEQVEKVRTETRAVQESVERAREVLEGLGKVNADAELVDKGASREVQRDQKKRRRENLDRRVWEVLKQELRE